MYTYYSLIIKLFASEIVCIVFNLLPESVTRLLLNSKNLKEDLRYIEEGKFFQDFLGVENYIEGGFFSWYLDVWDSEIEKLVKKILMKIIEYDSRSFVEDGWTARDLLKNLYQEIVPRRIRHDLGEYYTPDWVIELVLDEIGYDGNPKYKILDPGCGSGGFLVEIINRIKHFAINNGSIDESTGKQLLRTILSNVIGFDVNPVAVLTARTNYLLSILPLLRFRDDTITIPVFLADSVITPTTEGPGKVRGKFYQISTVEGLFVIPQSIVEKGFLDKFLKICEHCIENEYPVEDFLSLLFKEIKYGLPNDEIKTLQSFYEKLLKLHKSNKNKIWVKIIQNSFAPLLFQGKFDYVVGNPPWIKWEFLDEDYKKKLGILYLKVYKLWSYGGMKAGLGFAHDDISIVFTYVCMDKYLKLNGKLGFVLKQTLYKSVAGKEFRKFYIEKENEKIPVKVLVVHDLVKLRPFRRSGSETSVIIMNKGEQTLYPVRYNIWRLKDGHKLSEITDISSLDGVKRAVIVEEFDAYPATDDPTDVWTLVPKGGTPNKIHKKLNPYKSEIRHGVVNDLNSVFFIRIIKKNPNGTIQIENLNDLGKRKVKKVRTDIEPDLVYPVIKPRHVRKWKIEGYYYMIVPQKKAGENNERDLRTNYPKTYAYLHRFKNELIKRSSRWFKGGDKPFYSLFGIGEYTFKPYKVVWCPMIFPPRFAVAFYVNDEYVGNKVYIPDNTIGYISFDSKDEAYYVCAILNSPKIAQLLENTSSKSKWAVSISAVKQLPIPKYDPSNKDYVTLSRLSMKAHQLALKNKVGELNRIEDLINKITIRIL